MSIDPASYLAGAPESGPPTHRAAFSAMAQPIGRMHKLCRSSSMVLAVCSVALTGSSLARANTKPALEPIPSIYDNAEKFLAAITSAEKGHPRKGRVTGLTLPHHILAADLVAKGLAAVDPSSIRTVVILSPDHFKKAQKPFATTQRDFETVFGRITTNRAIVDRLLDDEDLIEPSALFRREHGVQVLLPFIKRYFPNAQIVPIAVALRARRASWDRMGDLLARLVDPSTLIIQSTDFSHYLTAAEAADHDQKVLNALALGDLEAMARFRQPDDVDSVGSQYLQFKLQRDVFRAEPEALYNENSQARSDVTEAQTTSYIVVRYAPDTAATAGEMLAGSSRFCFVGDTFFGRLVGRELARPAAAHAFEAELKILLDGCPVIANLEGVITEKIPENLAPTQLAMSGRMTRHWLGALHVAAVSLANNHTKDLGEGPYAAMPRTLETSGVKALMPFVPRRVEGIEITAMTDLDNSVGAREGLITDAQIAAPTQPKRSGPRVAFVHWGREFEAAAHERQKHLAEMLGRAGFSLIVGAHPHRRSNHLERVGDGQAIEAYSLGNFLFDQSARHTSGALLTLRVFDQGTFFPMLMPLPNFFDHLRRCNAEGYCFGSVSGGGNLGLK